MCIQMCIESGVFCDAGSGLTRWGFGPMPFGLAWPQKRPEGLAWVTGQERWTTMARPGGTTCPAMPGPIIPCLAWAHAVPGQAGRLLIFTEPTTGSA